MLSSAGRWALDKRKWEGKRGGVRMLVFLAERIWPEGERHSEELPFFEKDVSCISVCLSSFHP
jgi:hypothetical protein